MLSYLGLDGDQTALYRALVERPSATSADLAVLTNLTVPHVEETLSSLALLGLVARQAAESSLAVASPPGVALRGLLAEQEQRIAAVRAGIAELEAIYQAAAQSRSMPDVVDLVLGEAAVRQRFAQLQAGAEREVMAFVCADVAFVSARDNVEEDRALLRGVRYRVVVEQACVEQPDFVVQAKEAADLGEEVRSVPSLVTRLLLVDRELALLPVRSLGGTRLDAVLVRPSSLLEVIAEHFESTWAQGTPVIPRPASPDSDLDGVDRALLALLAVGLTDERIATQLGISPRSVQRRIRVLMDLAAASTRFQLGAAAAREGWL